MKHLLLCLALLVSVHGVAAQQSDFEKAYYPVLNHFASVRMEREDFIAVQGDRAFSAAERKKLNSIDCALWKAELAYNQLVLQRFAEYIKFSGEQIDDINAAKALYQDDIRLGQEQIRNHCAV